jgi:hypothetical protein
MAISCYSLGKPRLAMENSPMPVMTAIIKVVDSQCVGREVMGPKLVAPACRRRHIGPGATDDPSR